MTAHARIRRLATAFALLFSGAAHAQDASGMGEPKLHGLEALLEESIVTTASRSAERSSTAPAAVFTISAEEMRVHGVRSVDEALAYLGVGMHVQKHRDYTAGLDVGAQGIMLRDYGRHLLVLLDGHVMNSQSSGVVALHEGVGVPLEAIDHIEVMLGAGSVMYGANAMTAVVHIVTKSPERDEGVHAVGELSVAPPSSSEGYARSTRGPHDPGFHYRLGAGAAHTYRLASRPLQVALRAEWREELSQTYEVDQVSGEGWDLRASESTWGGLASHRMRAPAGVASLRYGDLTLRGQASYYERGMPLVGLFADDDARELRTAARVDLSHSALLYPTLRLASRLYADYASGEERSRWTRPFWCLPGQIDGCSFRFQEVGRWIGGEQQLSFEPRADGSLITSFGYDVRLRDASGRSAEYRDIVDGSYPIAQPVPYYHTQSVLGALFLQQLYSPRAWLTLNLGARLDLDSVFGARLSPRAAVVVLPVQGASLRASYAEAFRGPTAFELNQGDGTYSIPPTSLGPEIVRTAELEWQQRVGFVSLSLRGYAAFYEGMIEMRAATADEVARASAAGDLASTADPDFIVTSDNVARIESYGGSLSVELRPTEALTLAGSTTVSRSSSPSSVLTLWPTGFGNARVAYDVWEGGPTLALSTVFALRRRAFNDIAEELRLVDNPYTNPQLDLRLTVTSPVRPIPGLHVRGSAGVRLLPDQPYLVTVPTHDAPSERTQYAHGLPQLHLLIGASYDF